MRIKNNSVVFHLLVILTILLCGISMTETISAQNDSGSILELLKQAAADYKGLGSYLWDQTHGDYVNLGEFTAGELIKFLNKGISHEFNLNGKPTTIKITPKDDLSDITCPFPEFNIEVTQDGTTEKGILKVDQNAIRQYVHQKLFPGMKSQLTGDISESVPLVKDIVNLLAGSAVVNGHIIPNMNTVWTKLTENMDSYPEIKNFLQISSTDPLLIVIKDESSEGDQTETSLFSQIFSDGQPSGDTTSFVQSGSELVSVFTKIDENPAPDVDLDIDHEEEHTDPPHRGSVYYTLFPLLIEQLPATGFSANQFTPLNNCPKKLSFEKNGFTLQIPQLDVTESIVTVPLTESGFAVEWIDRNIGLLEGSSLPGEGITILTGHNHLNTTEAGPFLFIGSIEEGDRLFITNAENELLSYKVYGNYKIAADGFASIVDDLRENSLVLITCEDESMDGGYINRRIIFAEPV